MLIQGDDLQNIMHEMHRGGLFGKVAIGLDYFDATINRVAAWSIGLRACSKAILTALLTPDHLLEQAEQQGDLTARLALTDEFQNLPYNAVWDMLLSLIHIWTYRCWRARWPLCPTWCW